MILHALFLNSVFWSHPLSPCRVFDDAFFLPRELWLNNIFSFAFRFAAMDFPIFAFFYSLFFILFNV